MNKIDLTLIGIIDLLNSYAQYCISSAQVTKTKRNPVKSGVLQVGKFSKR